MKAQTAWKIICCRQYCNDFTRDGRAKNGEVGKCRKTKRKDRSNRNIEQDVQNHASVNTCPSIEVYWTCSGQPITKN